MMNKSNENTFRHKNQYSEIEAEEKITDLYEGEDDKLEKGHYDEIYLRFKTAEKIYHIARTSELSKERKEELKLEYVEALIDYGTYQKERRRDEQSMGINEFQKALSLSENLPKVYYRLGHVYYSQGDKVKSLYNFLMSLSIPENRWNKFNLDEVQKKTAEKFTAALSLIQFNTYKTNALNHELYPELNNEIEKVYKYFDVDAINRKTVKMRKNLEKPTDVTHDEYISMIEEHDVLILDRYSNEHCLIFNEKELPLKPRESEMLEQIILDSSFYPESFEEKKYNTKIKYFNRFREKLKKCFGVDKDHIIIDFGKKKVNGVSKEYLGFHSKYDVLIFTKIND